MPTTLRWHRNRHSGRRQPGCFSKSPGPRGMAGPTWCRCFASPPPFGRSSNWPANMSGERAAWWGLAFFLAEPLIVFAAGLASTDAFCLTVMIWFLFFADKMVRTGQLRWWLPTALFALFVCRLKIAVFHDRRVLRHFHAAGEQQVPGLAPMAPAGRRGILAAGSFLRLDALHGFPGRPSGISLRRTPGLGESLHSLLVFWKPARAVEPRI